MRLHCCFESRCAGSVWRRAARSLSELDSLASQKSRRSRFELDPFILLDSCTLLPAPARNDGHLVQSFGNSRRRLSTQRLSQREAARAITRFPLFFETKLKRLNKQSNRHSHSHITALRITTSATTLCTAHSRAVSQSDCVFTLACNATRLCTSIACFAIGTEQQFSHRLSTHTPTTTTGAASDCIARWFIALVVQFQMLSIARWRQGLSIDSMYACNCVRLIVL